MTWTTLTFPAKERGNTDTDVLGAALRALPQLAPVYDENYNQQASVRLGFNSVGELEVSVRPGVTTEGVARVVHETAEEHMPWAWHGATNLTTETAYLAGTSYFVYIGKATASYTSLSIVARVTTAAVATITWAELGVFVGTPPPQLATGSLTRVGWTDVAATFNSTGQKTTVVPVTGVIRGDDLWVAFGSDAATAYQVRAGLADDLQTGRAQQVAERISVMDIPEATITSAATLAVPMLRITPT